MNRRRKFLLLNGGAADTTKPTITITSSQSSPSAVNPIPITFTLSEVSTDFAIGDVTVGAGGTLGNFAGSGTAYTADLTVTTALATITLDVAADAFHDAAGNGNTAATQFSITSSLSLLDNFTTNAAAPLSVPRNAEPGPGVFPSVLVDTGNRVSIAGNKLRLSLTAGTQYGDPGAWGAGIARAAGRTIRGTIRWTNSTSRGNFGWGNDQNGTLDENAIQLIGSQLNPLIGAVAVVALATQAVDTNYDLAVVLRSAGAYYVIDGKLEWVDVTKNTATVYPSIIGGNLGGTQTLDVDNLQLVDYGSPWNTDWGLATNRVATPGVNEVTTSVANALVEMTWTAVTGQVWNFMTRRTDDDNCWIIRADQANSKIYLYEKQGGVETERGATGGTAQTWTNGVATRVVVVQDDDTIKVFTIIAGGNPTLKITYTSASFNNTATGVKTDRAGTNLVAWPRAMPPF